MPRHTQMEAGFVAGYERARKSRRPARPELWLMPEADRKGKVNKARTIEILARTHGFARKSAVPSGARPKLCRKCDLWFAARPREQVCDGCVTAPERVKRLGGLPVPGTPKEHYGAPGQRGSGDGPPGRYSEVLGLTFEPGVPVEVQLSIEAAAQERWSAPARPRPAAFEVAHKPDCECEPCGSARPPEYVSPAASAELAEAA